MKGALELLVSVVVNALFISVASDLPFKTGFKQYKIKHILY